MPLIQSGASADKLTVSTAAKSARATVYSETGAIVVQNDNGTSEAGILIQGGQGVTGAMTRNISNLRIGNAVVDLSQKTLLFFEEFEGTVVNPNRWTITATTATSAQTTTHGLIMNQTAIATNTGYMIRSTKTFPVTTNIRYNVSFRARLRHYPNSNMELGLSDTSATIAINHSNGAFWHINENGALLPVLASNGFRITGEDVRSLIDNENYYTFDVIVNDDSCQYMMKESKTGKILSDQTIRMPVTSGTLFTTNDLRVMARVNIVNATLPASTVPLLYLSSVYMYSSNIINTKPWSHTMATLERRAHLLPTTAVQNIIWTNSAEPASSTLSNSAPSLSVLGGKFQFAAVAGAATDYALVGFVNNTGANLIITGVDIELWNIGAANSGATPTVVTWCISCGSTVATASTNRVGLGTQTIPISSPIGFRAKRVTKSFEITPLHCAQGRYVHVYMRIPVGAATSSQVIAGMINIDGYFE